MSVSLRRIYLASRSPRRQELLRQIGVAFELVDGEVDEATRDGESPGDYVLRLAQEKAAAGRRTLTSEGRKDTDAIVLGADTTVALGCEALGKPSTLDAAIEHLSRMSGRRHQVYSAVAIKGQADAALLSQTSVWFRDLSRDEIHAYCRTMEPFDKAGSYAIQGLAAVFVERIEGSYSGVMGLPLFETACLLRDVGIRIPYR